jgi:hypothetical protein
MTGPNIRFDSIQMRKVSGVASGDIYFDEASTRALGGGTVTGPSAAVQFDSETTRVIYFGFPFETIIGEATRNEVMTRSLNFLLRSNEPEPAGSPTGWLTQ